MKLQGFNRVVGNEYTNATHGSKSNIFTQEEKYVWLAVHHIIGYLADHLPLLSNSKFIDDYMKIIDIENPVEFLEVPNLDNRLDSDDNWLIKESLAPEMEDIEGIEEQIKLSVESEPEIDFNKWIEFQEHDFLNDDSNASWIALFNNTTVKDSKAYTTSALDIRGVIIEKNQAQILKDILRNEDKRSRFVENIDRMASSPDTYIYSNPTDVTWMRWIEDRDESTEYYPLNGEVKFMKYAVSSVTNNSIENGDEEVMIPSKLVREMLGISEMSKNIFFNEDGEAMAANHLLRQANYDQQEITLVPKDIFLKHLETTGQEIVWFADLYRSTNTLNKSITTVEHYSRSRKYFIWLDNGELCWGKFWDARYTNRRY